MTHVEGDSNRDRLGGIDIAIPASTYQLSIEPWLTQGGGITNLGWARGRSLMTVRMGLGDSGGLMCPLTDDDCDVSAWARAYGCMGG